MRSWLVWVVVVGSAVACTLSEIQLFRMFDPPDTQAAILGGLWVAMPFLAAAGFALFVRRHLAALVTLVIVLVLTSVVGVYLLEASASAHEESLRQSATAVLPGEDPNSGAAGKRKAGADIGEAVTGVFAIVLVVVLVPAQLAGVVIPTGIAWGISAAVRARREDEQVL